MNEQDLIQGLRNGDELAFKYLVLTYQDRVYNTAISIVQNVGDAEDVSQEVFIQVYRSIHHFKGESKLSTWLYRIATTRSLDLLRSRKSKKRFGFIQRLFGDGNEPLFELPDFNHPGILLEKKKMQPGCSGRLLNYQKIKKLLLRCTNWKILATRR